METRRDRHGPADRRRTPLAAAALALTLGGVLVACGQGDDATPLETAATAGVPATDTGAVERAAVDTTAGTATSAAAVSTGADGSIAGVQWQLATLLEGESTGPVPDGVVATLQIDGDVLTINAGCNSGGGTVAVAEGLLRLDGPLQLTQRACEGDALRVEQFVVKVLDAGPMFRIDRGRLRLDTGLGRGLEFTAV